MSRLKPQPQAYAAAEVAPAVRKVLHNVEDAATALSIGRTTVFKLIRDGDLLAVKIHGRTLVPVAEEEAYAVRLALGAKS